MEAFDVSGFKELANDLWHVLTTSKAKGGLKMLNHYLLWSGVFMAIFALTYLMTYIFWDNILFRSKHSSFQSLNRSKKLEYVGRLTASLHAVIVTVTSTLGCFFMCDDSTKTIFNSQECYVQPKMFH